MSFFSSQCRGGSRKHLGGSHAAAETWSRFWGGRNFFAPPPKLPPNCEIWGGLELLGASTRFGGPVPPWPQPRTATVLCSDADAVGWQTRKITVTVTCALEVQIH